MENGSERCQIPKTAQHIGKRILRREDEALLRGNGHFIDDLPEPQGMVHLGFRHPHSHALIGSTLPGAERCRA